MAESILKIHTQNGDVPVGYPGLADKPISDKTLSKEGAFADSKAVGDRFKEVNAETDSLKEDLSNKITKFYASNQGETHITDSDNGKIQDMMIYGKSEQKQYSGKNLLNPTLQTTIKNGITCINNGDGTYTLNGTATSDTQLVVGYHNILDGQVKMLGCPSGGSTKTYCVIMQFSSNITGGEKGRIYDIGNGGVGSTSNSIEPGANYIRGIISIISGTTCNNLLFKPMITTDLTATYDNFEPYHKQTVTLPYTLNAIPVSAGGNVTIDGQQYIADYVDVEREKLVRMVDSSKLDNTQSIVDKTEWLLAEPQEIDLTTEEITAFKELATYYPTTHISVTSEQLDGYTVFNYPISMANGWNYVKKQLNDNRDYIYDMDIQSAEAYVNSEYAVALTELEV